MNLEPKTKCKSEEKEIDGICLYLSLNLNKEQGAIRFGKYFIDPNECPFEVKTKDGSK